jgi:RHS repeat-associated protein
LSEEKATMIRASVCVAAACAAAVSLLIAVPAAASAVPAAAAAGGTIVSSASDVHDANGRLLAVVEPAGDAYLYGYDAAGNILSVTHRAAGLSILRMSPSRARPGQVVHLYGTGFSGTAANDQVTVEGVAAATKVASPVQLDVTVPSGFTGGAVTLTIGSASVSSAAPLGLAPAPPVISSVTASSPLQPGTLMVAPGATLVINGAGFDATPASDRVMIGQELASVVSATATQLTVQTPPGPAFSGRLAITTPAGSVTGPDVFTVPNQMFGGSAGFPVAARVTSGEVTSVALSSTDQAALLLIDGQAGRRLSFSVGAGTLATGTVQLYAPGGDNIIRNTPESATQSVSFDQTARVLFATTLRRNGTYLLAITSDSGGGTVPVTVQVFDDTVQPITPDGAAVTASVSAAGNRVVLPFTVTTPEQFSVQYSGSTFTGNGSTGDFLYLTDRTGNAIGPVGTYSASLESGSAGYIVTTKTLFPGPYAVVVDPSQSGDTGSVVLRLRAFSDQTGAITLDGPAVTASLTVPGQRALYSFGGTAGTEVNAQITGDTLPGDSDRLELLGPDGSTVATTSVSPGSGTTYLQPQVLPSTGTYQLVVDTGTSGDTGSATLKVFTVTDATGTITPNGPAVTPTITTPGQRAIYSFTGTAATQLSAQFTASTTFTSGDELKLLAPDGSTLAETGIGNPSGFLTPSTLPSTGTYQLVVDPSTTGDTGSVSIQAFSFTDQTGTITPNGPAVTPTITTPGQRAIYSFSVTSSVAVTTSWTGSTFSSGDEVELLASDGSSEDISSISSADGSLGPDTLPAAGTYQVVIDPSRTGDVGSVSVTLTSSAASAARPHHVTPAAPAPPGRHVPPSVWPPAMARHHPGPAPDGQRAAGLVSTTLAGVVLKDDNRPLAGVTLSVGTQRVTSNALGQFTLRGIAAGRQLLRIDGTTAAPAGAWGYFTEVVDLVAGFRNQVPAPVWMTRLDNAHAVRLPARITKPIVVTTPRIPGLQLHIAAGTVIRDRNGAIVRRISITPIPVDHPPFPLPVDTPIPMYFTIQPGGATITGDGVQLVYPNWGDQRPGTRMTFWSYGEKWDGWWVYGHGTVSRDGKEVVPDKGTHLEDFQGAMFNSGTQPPGDGPGRQYVADPVDMSTGLFGFSRTDLTEPDALPLSLTRKYRQNDPSVYRFGVGTNDLYGINLWSTSMASGNGWLNVALVLPDGRQVPFTRTTPDTTFSDAQFAETDLPGPFYGSVITWNGLGWDLTLTDGLTYTFGEVAPLQSITDRYGNAIEVTHSSGQSVTGPITNVTSPNGRWMEFSYNGPNCSVCVSEVTDNAGRTVSYAYDDSQRLVAVTDVRGNAESYAYDASNDMTTVTDPLGNVIITNTYNPDGTVQSQTTPSGGTVTFSYVKNPAGQVTQAISTDQRGAVRTMTFNSFQEPLTDVQATMTSLQRTTTYEYDPVSGLVTKATDPLGRVTTYTYDQLGEPVAQTQLAGAAGARTTRQTFDPVFGRLTSVTDPAGNVTRFAYSDAPGGSTETTTDPDGHTTKIAIEDGNVTSITDGAGGQQTAGYDGGDLASVTDADGHTMTRFVNNTGFAVTSTSPDGATTSYAYDPAGDLTSTTDPLGGVTSATFDAVGNQLTYADADNHTTTYAYDALYRLITQTDPLGASQQFAYDAAGDLTSYTDRNGSTDLASYDILGELTSVSWGAQGSTAQDTTTYTYDSAGRRLSVNDASNGSITSTFDGFNDLTSQAQPAGTVNYAYDADGRPTSVTAGTGPAVSYAYDAAGLPVTVTAGSSTATLSYDTAGRLATIADPGVTQAYTYDPASNVTGITTTGASPLTIGYAYDANNQQATETASRPLLLAPSLVSAVTYNADNEATTINGLTISYDKNGALLNDGTSSYTWNAQRQLTAITSGSATTKVGDDALGRPAAVTTAAGTTRYLFNGSAIALAITPTDSTSYAADPATQATLLEAGSTGAVSLTSDRLGSPTAVVGPSGTTLASYSYDPFGATSASGASTSAIGYAGYHQAVPGLDGTANRYYSPALDRFISQDPLGLAAGQNAYAYALNNPADLTDPSGLEPHKHKGIDFFGFGALTAGTDTPIRPEVEGIGVVGWNTSNGWFGAVIAALGVAVGSHEDYGAEFVGVESTTKGETTPIIIYEMSVDNGEPFLGGTSVGAGVFSTGTGEFGWFFFAQGGIYGEYGSLGVGVGW